jgi:deoxyribonuclease V
MLVDWPGSFDQLIEHQHHLGRAEPPLWALPPGPQSVGGCFVCFPRGKPGVGAQGDPGWAAAALLSADRRLFTSETAGTAGSRYQAGLLALREGSLLEAAIRALPSKPAVLLVNATGRDHPRKAGLALHLGAVLDLPTVGITHRPLVAKGEWPRLERGAHSPLLLAGEMVGHWLCTRDATRPLAVHAAWRTDPDIALAVALRASSGRARTPEPIRQARRVARTARAATHPPV